MNIPLRAKLGLTLFVAVAAFLGVDHWLRQRAFRSTFHTIEMGHAKQQVAELRHVVKDLVVELAGEARRIDEASIGSALVGTDERVDLALVVGADGTVLGLEVRDPVSRAPITLRDFPTERLAPSHPLMSPWLARSLPEGIIETEIGFLVVGSVEVGNGEDVRLIVTGQVLNESRVAELGALTSIGFGLASMTGRSSIGSASVSQDSMFRVQGELAMGATIIVPNDRHGVAVGALKDLRGIPTVALAVELPEPVWVRLESYARLTSIALAIVFPLGLLILLQFLVTGPLSRLTSMATEIAASDDRTLRLRMSRRDEIGRLSHKFDVMLDEIERARLAEARTARTVGRSEIAVGVMHNVGNLVNSLQVSAALARDGASAAKVDDLALILAALRENEGDLDRYLSSDPKGAHLLEFFEKLVPQLEAAQEITARETDAVLAQVGEITDMVQSLVGEQSSKKMMEAIDVGREIEEAVETAKLEFGSGSLAGGDRANDPTFQIELDGQIGGQVDRMRVQEVLLALLSNAWDASSSSEHGAPIIRVRSEQLEDDFVRIVVSDNGPGLETECGEEIYTMGFSTREGRAGLGLHLASLAASELGGGLQCLPRTQSGPAAQGASREGASFAFDFPLRRATVKESGARTLKAAS